jgi:predicted Fe-Mo cluster-binding NifX family protein
MKMGLPSVNDKVYPSFDAATSILVVEVDENKEISRREQKFDDMMAPEGRAAWLKKLGVNVVICGSVSNSVAGSMMKSGITLIPWVSGKVNEVVKDFLDGRLPDSSRYLP